MAFTKGSYRKDVVVAVAHPWHEGVEFVFTFLKQLPDAAQKASEKYFGMSATEKTDERLKVLIEAVAEMVTIEPEGFDDFPKDERPLNQRVVEYFSDSGEPELERVIVSAWNLYWESSIPQAYVKTA